MARAKNPDEFQQAHYDLMDLAKEQPVDNKEIMDSLANVLTVAEDFFTNDRRKPDYIAKFVRLSLDKAVSVEVVPPLSEDQVKAISIKNSFWARITEHSTQSGTTRKTATPTNKIRTDHYK